MHGSTIRNFVFDDNILEPKCIETFSNCILNLRETQRLSFASCKLGNEGVISIANTLLPKQKLQYLNLHNNRIGVFLLLLKI